MTASDRLLSKGWKQVGERHNGHGTTKYWTHPDHQRKDGRFYTTTGATDKQKFIDKPWAYTDPDADE